MLGSSRQVRRAFTLIELLVVVAIIALLIAILLPGLRSAREEARAAKCGAQLRGFGNGFGAYFAENDDWIPGVNTTGVALTAIEGKAQGNPRLLRRSYLPTQTYDWITPLIRYDTEQQDTRAKRFHFLLDYYRCPSVTTIEPEIFQRPPDGDDFDALPGPRVAVSYLMDAYFQYWGGMHLDRVVGSFEGTDYPIAAQVISGERGRLNQNEPRDWEVDSRGYLSQLQKVGPPARKIAVTDGTRYLDSDKLLDYDVNPWPGYFGSFTDGGGWWCGSTAYGVRQGSLNWDDRPVPLGSPSEGENLLLTYRHGGASESRVPTTARENPGAINALFFDGHVARLRDRASREITYWYPSGSVVRKPTEGMTRALADFEIP